MHDSHKMGTTRVSIMDRCVVHMECHWAVKRGEALTLTMTWTDLEHMTLSETPDTRRVLPRK